MTELLPGRQDIRKLVATSAAMSRYPQLWTGLHGYWALGNHATFGTSSNTSPVRDISGYHNHGQPTGVTTFDDWFAARIGFAFNMDGTDDYISTPLNMSSLNQFTISAWVNRGASGRNAYIASDSGAAVNLLQLGWFSSDDKFYIKPAGSSFQSSSAADSAGDEWVHLTYVFDGSLGSATTRNRLFKNGIEVAMTGSNTETTTNAAAGDLDIGRRLQGGIFSTANFSDVGVWFRALRDSEVVMLARGQSPAVFDYQKLHLVTKKAAVAPTGVTPSLLLTGVGV